MAVRRRPIDERVVRLKSGDYVHEKEYVRKGRFASGGMYDTDTMERTTFVTISPPGRPDVRMMVGCLPQHTTGTVCRRTTVQKRVKEISPQRAAVLRRAGVRGIRKNPRRKPVLVTAVSPGITKLPEGAWSEWTTSRICAHMAQRAGQIGAGPAMRAVMNIERWNKRRDPSLSRKAGQVVECMKRSPTYQKALAANPACAACTDPSCTSCKAVNPQLMVIANPRKKRVVTAAVRPGVTGLPSGAWTSWSVKQICDHMSKRAKAIGAGPAMRAVMNIERWNKTKNPPLSKKAGQVVECLKRSPVYQKALAANPQLMVVNDRDSKLAEKAYKRFHFTKPAKRTTGWVPDGWPKAYITIGDALRFDVRTPAGKVVKKEWKRESGVKVVTPSDMKDVYIFGTSSLGIPSGTALRVDYSVPSNSKRRKWSRDWTHAHDTAPKVHAHPSGKAVKISGRGLKVTPSGIEG